jgi:hypothetical protein
MLLSELPEYLDAEFAYPIELGTVIERAGTVRIDGANSDESETLDVILGSLGTDTVQSSEALFEMIYGNVSDDFIGRKYYDDRGGNPPDVAAGPQDLEDVSF